MPPTVWCAQHAVRFPFNPGSDEQTCPAGHGLRLEGVVGYCPSCDLQWDVRQVEQPETCPYCQTSNVQRHLCHVCLRLTYIPVESAEAACQGCGTPFAQPALSHVCRVLRVEFVTSRQVCPACQEPIRQPVPRAKSATEQDRKAVQIATPAAVSNTTEKQPEHVAGNDEAEGIRLTRPVPVRELHARYGSRLVRVHFDYNLRRFFRNEKGLFYACSIGAPPMQYHIIPSWSRFGVAGDFIHWFSEIFDCPHPKGGNIWIHAPAVADAEGALLRKGLLEIDRPPEELLLSTPSLRPTPAEPTLSALHLPSPVPPVAAGVPVSSAVDVTPQTIGQPQVAAAMHTGQPDSSPTGTSTPATASPVSRSRRPRSARWWMLAGLFLLFAAVGVGLAIYFVAPTRHQPDKSPARSTPLASRPNQPQAANQTNQEAILVALEGLTLAFNGQLMETYATYFDRTLRPYGNRRETPREQVVEDLRRLSETYVVTMAHQNPRVEVDAQGKQATVRADRRLTCRHRQTGQVVEDTQYVTYRFVKRGSHWLIAGMSHPATVALPPQTPGQAGSRRSRG
jgi:hypothetical protein